MDNKHVAFRQEVLDFLKETLTEDLRADATLATSVFPEVNRSLQWQRILHAKGWAAPNWPQEYGGPDWDTTQRHIFATECARAKTPRLIPMGIGMCGPAIIGYGTPEQKSHYLPKILSAEHIWCQGYSEPNAGSDLASLSCAAVPDGDNYIVNGSKIWTSQAHHATHIFCLVRTSSQGRPQQGISFLLIDMKTPGITVKPILNLNRVHEQNSVFFDNVRVPKANRIGAENDGWTVAKYLLQFERGESLNPTVLADQIDMIKAAAKTQRTENGSFLYDDKSFRRKLAKLEIDMHSFISTDHRLRSAKTPADEPLGGASLMKIVFSNMSQRVSALHVEVAGIDNLYFQPEALVPGNNVQALAHETNVTAMGRHLDGRSTTIFGGSNEIQHNIITKSVLGL